MVLRYLFWAILVSIPFSTIKSYTRNPTMMVDAMFQFHLVRLKDTTVQRTIFHMQFQFHLVRLKGSKPKLHKRKNRSFNSI